jgi:hypothetical protein
MVVGRPEAPADVMCRRPIDEEVVSCLEGEGLFYFCVWRNGQVKEDQRWEEEG